MEFGVLWRSIHASCRQPSNSIQLGSAGECLAVKQCLVVWRHYLLGAPFNVKSDHESLKWLSTQDVATLSVRLLRWVEFFSLFDFDQGYIPGEMNVLPDHLSRPISTVSLSSDQDDSRCVSQLLALNVVFRQHEVRQLQAQVLESLVEAGMLLNKPP